MTQGMGRPRVVSALLRRRVSWGVWVGRGRPAARVARGQQGLKEVWAGSLQGSLRARLRQERARCTERCLLPVCLDLCSAPTRLTALQRPQAQHPCLPVKRSSLQTDMLPVLIVLMFKKARGHTSLEGTQWLQAGGQWVSQELIYSLFEVGTPPGQAGNRGNLQGVRASCPSRLYQGKYFLLSPVEVILKWILLVLFGKCEIFTRFHPYSEEKQLKLFPQYSLGKEFSKRASG